MKKLKVLCLALALTLCFVGIAGEAVGRYESGVSITAVAANIVKGDTAANIKKVQQRLKELGYYKIAVDGIWGPKTRAAVIAFQRDYGLTQDGIVGSRTEKALGITLSSSSSSGAAGGYSTSDMNLLARCVYAEARGEPYT